MAVAPDEKQLSTDPDLFTQNRVFPQTFGFVHHVPKFLLAVACASGCGGELYSDGKTVQVYDAGLETNFTQAGTTTTKTNSVVHGITTSIDGEDSGNGIETTKQEPIISTRTFSQSSEPLLSQFTLMQNDVWYDTNNNNKMYLFNESTGQWVDTTITYNGISGTKPNIDADRTASNPQSYSWVTGSKPDINADHTSSQMNSSVTISSNGGALKAGKTAYHSPDSSTQPAGFFLGRSSTINESYGLPVLDIGNDRNWLKWTGSDIAINGNMLSFNGTKTNATRLKISGAKITNDTSSSSDRYSFDVIEDGQDHYYSLNTSTFKWDHLLSLGDSTGASVSSGVVGINSNGFYHGLAVSGNANETITAINQKGGGKGINVQAQQNSSYAGYFDATGTNSYGVYGRTNNNNSVGVFGFDRDNDTGSYGVKGASSYGTGTYGESDEGVGVQGRSTSNSGLYGSSDSYVGAYGSSLNHVGIYGESTNQFGGRFTGGKGAIQLMPQSLPSLTSSEKGVIVFDSSSNQFKGWNGSSWITF